MGGVQRATKFARYLPEFGWQPHVITVKDILYYAYDQTLLKEVNHLPVVRTDSLDPARIAKILHFPKSKQSDNSRKPGSSGLPSVFAKFLRRIFYPDSKTMWIPFAAQKIRNLSKNIQFDAVYSTAPPISAHLVANKFKIPWIADFRDYWTTEDGIYAPTKWHKKKYTEIMSLVSENAAKIIAVSEPIAESIRSQSSLEDSGKVSIIPNGFDPNDFSDIHPEHFDRFTISYLGNLNRQRSPNLFIDVLKDYIDENPDMKDKLRVQFIGKHFSINLPPLIGPLSDTIHFMDYMPHSECLAFALGSNALLFILSQENAPGIATGKIFEYLGTGKPILALVPTHTTAYEILQNKPNCYIAEPHKPEQIKYAFDNLLQDHFSKPPKMFSTDQVPDYLKKYERRYQAGQLAHLLDQCIIKNS